MEGEKLPLDSPEVHSAKVAGWVRLFKYVQEVAKHIGEEKALEILSKIKVKEHMKWFQENASKLDLSGDPLQAAHRMLIEGWLGRDLEAIKVVERSEDRIVQHYDLPCSVLDACLKVGFDTRKICRAIHQKSINAIIQRVDPRLRFDRDYGRIRPYENHCVETLYLRKQNNNTCQDHACF